LAFEFKPFLFFTIISAIVIASIAALFSVTGIATLFSGHFIQVAIMAGSLEAGKIILASILYRYWNVMSKGMKIYMTSALLVLMLITSGGIFGYLSESYQKTKGNYDVVDKEILLLDNKKSLFQKEYDRYQLRLNDLTGNRKGQEARLDSLYSRKSISAARGVESNIKRQDEEITILNNKLLLVSDSLSVVDTRLIEKQQLNISGELGPLQYIAKALNMEMDSVVKWFILILIFVFDPLSISLIVAANMIYINRHYERPKWTNLFNRNPNKDVPVTKEVPSEVIYDNNEVSPKVISEASEVKEDDKTEVPKTSRLTKYIPWKSSNWIEPKG